MCPLGAHIDDENMDDTCSSIERIQSERKLEKSPSEAESQNAIRDSSENYSKKLGQSRARRLMNPATPPFLHTVDGTTIKAGNPHFYKLSVRLGLS